MYGNNPLKRGRIWFGDLWYTTPWSFWCWFLARSGSPDLQTFVHCSWLQRPTHLSNLTRVGQCTLYTRMKWFSAFRGKLHSMRTVVFFFSFVDSPKFKTSGTRHRYSYTILSPFTKFVSVHPLPRIHRDICSRSLGSSHGCFVSKGFFPVGAIHPDSLAVSKSCATWSQGRWPRWGCKQCIHTTWYVGISERLYNIYN